MTSYSGKRSYGGSYSSSSVKRHNTNGRAKVQPFVYDKTRSTFDFLDDEDNYREEVERLQGGTSSSNASVFPEVTYILSKADTSKETPSPVYSIFSPKPKKAVSKDGHSKFDDMYRNAFKGKRNINLYISNQRVIWEFSYNATIIAAVKAYVPNRSYNPTTKSWSCPLEDLPEAIELYEFMGRRPDADFQERSQQIRQARQSFPGPPQDDISLAVRCDRSTNGNNVPLLDAKVYVTFRFDAQIVSALKLLPPSQRNWDPATREWSLELQALPDLLEHLLPLDYKLSADLTALCQACRDLSKHLQDVSRLEEDYNKNQKYEVTVVNVDDDDDDDGEPQESHEKKMDTAQALLKESLHKTKDLLKAHQKSQPETKPSDMIDRGDCGNSKKPERTVAQEVWALQQKEGKSVDASYLDLYCKVLRKSQPPKEKRYYGSFVCRGCQNTWTSAYTWKEGRAARLSSVRSLQ